MKPHIFVTGTDTEVGKTVVATILAAGLDAHYWKPIQTGPIPDSYFARHWLGAARVLPETFAFAAPQAPALAGAIEGKEVTLEQISIPNVNGPLVVEGVGGLLVPLNKKYLLIDLIAQMAKSGDLAVVVVARTSLGTINHTLLTLEALRSRGLEPLGLIFVGEANPTTTEIICQLGRVAMLGHVPFCSEFRREWFQEIFHSFHFPNSLLSGERP